MVGPGLYMMIHIHRYIPDTIESNVNSIITSKKVLLAISFFNPYKTAGTDRITPAMIQKVSNILAPLYAFTKALDSAPTAGWRLHYAFTPDKYISAILLKIRSLWSESLIAHTQPV